MTQQEFLTHIQDALQRDEELAPSMRLDSLEEWDSLAIVSMISLYDTLFNLKVTGNQLRDCQTIQDLIQIIESELS
ncbi:acyl carrier protein [Helicobacter pametensis]|uniref:acyl carrier protein n=1 Tax=Helicobacter pametensis TaxID=95149 RepID=UPI000484849F|nr:phosphopantetheine-binding protein [Helicobacter pametensis]